MLYILFCLLFNHVLDATLAGLQVNATIMASGVFAFVFYQLRLDYRSKNSAD